MEDPLYRAQELVINQTPKSPKQSLLRKSLGQIFNEQMLKHVQIYEADFQDIFYAPSNEFAAARHTFTCLNTKLVQARNIWKEESKEIEERWKVSLSQQKQMYEKLPLLNLYYKDTFGKRNRATKAAALDQEQIERKDREIRRQKKDLDKLMQVKSNLENRFEQFYIYKSYLEAAKTASHGEYPDIKDLIERYGILADARDSLMVRNEFFKDTVTKRQRALDGDIIMKSNEVLAYRNYLSELMEYDSTLQEQVFRLDDSLLRIKTTAAQRTLVIGQIKMTIRNLYLQVCKSLHRHPKIAPEDTLGQLLDVRISIREMSRLSRDIRRMLKAASLAARQEVLARMKNLVLAAERLRRMDKLMVKKVNLDVRELFGLPPLKPKIPDINKILLTRS